MTKGIKDVLMNTLRSEGGVTLLLMLPAVVLFFLWVAIPPL